MEIDGGMAAGGSIEDVKDGQKMILYSIAIYIFGLLLSAVLPEFIIGIGLIGAMVLGVVGFFRLTKGLGYSTGKKILLFILLLIPLVSLITLVLLSGKATEKLRAAGYKVGLLGAQGQPAEPGR